MLHPEKWISILAKFDRWNERHIMSLFSLFGTPSDYLDVGCGTGAMVNLARRLGVDAWGIDLIPRPERHFVVTDLRHPFGLGRQFRLVTSIEVGEHIPGSFDANYADTVAKHVADGGLLIFTSAHPGQGGDEHINDRPASYWRGMFHDRGLTYQPQLSIILALAWSLIGSPMYWLPANVQVFSLGSTEAV